MHLTFVDETVARDRERPRIIEIAESNTAMSSDHKFQVNLQGVIDLLSDHLYTGRRCFCGN